MVPFCENLTGTSPLSDDTSSTFPAKVAGATTKAGECVCESANAAEPEQTSAMLITALAAHSRFSVAILLKNNRHLYRLSNEETGHSIAAKEQGNRL